MSLLFKDESRSSDDVDGCYADGKGSTCKYQSISTFETFLTKSIEWKQDCSKCC